ncbi:MAG: hypothetical protein K8J31_06740, partial [Anaerolineae bacterium]|nr:hypothetical protein [Anaerolineae bacterium]
NYNYDNDTSFGRIGFGKARDHDFSDHTGLNDYGNDATYPSTGGNKWYYFRSELAALPASDVTALMLNATNGTIANSPLKYETAVHPGYSVSPSDKTLDVGARSYCAVAYWPYSRNFEVPNSPTNLGESRSLMKLYEDAGFEWTEPNDHWEGFVPGYNYYRCCNDPNNNGYFEDALCQPFRSARDATEQFLQRVDFLRGDRVAFVTFDKQAYLMRVDTDPGSGETFSHMIDNEQLALDTLQNYIGVRAEPSFYEPTTLPDGTQVMPWTGRSSLLGIHDYDVLNNCPFQDAALTFPYSPTSSATYSMANTTLGIPGLYNAVSSPNRLTPDSFNPAPDGNGQRMYPRNSGGYNWQAQAGYGATRSYDLWASCRGTNVGAALREGGNALLDPYTTRTNGSVWVMVLLSDGAAGASDPVFDSSVGLVTEPNDLYYPYNSATSRVTYGGLGLCPPGTSAGGQAELTQFTEDPYVFPFCSDEVPETRNFCFDPNLQANIAGEQINLYVDLNKCDGGDRVFYDVDDYARDWADWIGLVEPRGLSSSSQRNLTQLPTIFTIGFGLNFRGGTTKCQQGLMNGADVPDCLGEELLRYISDVGDNFRIDTDYQQDLLDDTFLNNSLTVDDYGPRGECEADSGMGVIDPKTTKDNCGNYYNAPDATELNRVFDDIASRMFTRLTQ